MRIRTIKPEFWSNEDLALVSDQALLLAIGLLNYADDEGYFNANPKLMKASIFPLRDVSLIDHGLITELSNIGYVSLFNDSMNRLYGRVNKFLEHQVINRPKPSKIASLGLSPCESLIDHGLITDRSHPEQGTGNREGKEKEKGKKEKDFSEKLKIEEMVAIWNATLGDKLHKITKLTPSRISHFKARLRDSFSEVSEWARYCETLANAPFLLGKNERGWKADIDFCLKEGTITKVFEGGYQGAGFKNQKQNMPQSTGIHSEEDEKRYREGTEGFTVIGGKLGGSND